MKKFIEKISKLNPISINKDDAFCTIEFEKGIKLVLSYVEPVTYYVLINKDDICAFMPYYDSCGCLVYEKSKLISNHDGESSELLFTGINKLFVDLYIILHDCGFDNCKNF